MVLHSLKRTDVHVQKSMLLSLAINHWTPSTPPPPPAFATPVLLLASGLRDSILSCGPTIFLCIHDRGQYWKDFLSHYIPVPSTFLHISLVARVHAFLYTASIWCSHSSSHRRTFSRAASTGPRSDQLSQSAVLRLCISSNPSLGTSTHAINRWSLVIAI